MPFIWLRNFTHAFPTGVLRISDAVLSCSSWGSYRPLKKSLAQCLLGLCSVFKKRSCSFKPADWYTHVATRDQVRVACWWLLLPRNKNLQFKRTSSKMPVLNYNFYICNICFQYTLMQLWHNCLPKQKWP